MMNSPESSFQPNNSRSLEIYGINRVSVRLANVTHEYSVEERREHGESYLLIVKATPLKAQSVSYEFSVHNEVLAVRNPAGYFITPQTDESIEIVRDAKYRYNGGLFVPCSKEDDALLVAAIMNPIFPGYVKDIFSRKYTDAALSDLLALENSRFIQIGNQTRVIWTPSHTAPFN